MAEPVRQLPLPWPAPVDGWPRNNADLLRMLLERRRRPAADAPAP